MMYLYVRYTDNVPADDQSYMRKYLILPITLAALYCMACGTSISTENAVTENGFPEISQDLSNGKINAFEEDRQGHIWIGTFRGLNRYNGYDYHRYFCDDSPAGIPDNQVNDILRDSKGRMWIATVNGVSRYTEQDDFEPVPIDMPNKNAYQILEDRLGRIFLNFIFQLAVYNQENDRFECVIDRFDPQKCYSGTCHIDDSGWLWDVKPMSVRKFDTSTMEMKDSIPVTGWTVYSYLGKRNDLWLAGSRSLQLIDTRTGKLIPLPEAVSSCEELMSSSVTLIHEFGDNGLLFSTNDNGLFYFNATERTVVHQGDSGFPFEAPAFRIRRMFTDSQKNLWIGSVDQGYTVIYHYKERFNRNANLNTSLRNKSVRSVAAGKDGVLWISTMADGMWRYESFTGNLTHISIPGYEKIETGYVFEDDESNVWIATKPHGVLKCRFADGVLKAERKFDIFMPISILQDRNGSIWVSSSTNCIYCLKRGADEFASIIPFSGINTLTFIPSMLENRDGYLYVAAFSQPLARIDTGTLAVESTDISEENRKNCIRRSVFIPTDMFEDSNGDIWIGTIANGLLRYSPSTGETVPVPGVPCQDVTSIEEDEQGHLWVSTMSGLGKYDRTTGRFTNYYAADGIGGNQFYERSSCRMSDGTLVFGGTHGITFFHPVDVLDKRQITLLFEDLKIHNRQVFPYREGSAIDKQMSYNPDIHLDYRQNGFCISFAALDYCEFERVNYNYMLEGFDNYWIDAVNNREAWYSNLPAGKYTFKVRITNKDKNIVEAENHISISISPAPWLSWWAWVLYVLAAAMLTALFLRIWSGMRHQKEAARRAELEKEQERCLNKMNMSFFANVSHEFRTPLTMISGPVAQLCESDGITGDDKKLLLIVKRSVARMLRLVNQLMDFNKLENDTIRLEVQKTDVIDELRGQVGIFAVNAEEKGIDLKTSGLEDSFIMWVDADKLDKIVGNLLSNAMKFTPRGGRITLSFDTDSSNAIITVSDTGCGIPADQTEKIFERYYQADSKGGRYSWGTGIGLYYSRSLARIHHGDLTAANEPGGGARFTLTLPLSDSAYTQEEICRADTGHSRLCPQEIATLDPSSSSRSGDKEKKKVIAVDDDTEVMHYLETLLLPYYQVHTFFDAESAMTAVRDESPDLIVSDVVMPGKSGYELCREIKDDLQLCHIPVVLLTAKASVQEQVDGLDSGADAYVTKPFEPAYLLAVIKSQIKKSDNARRLLASTTQTDENTEDVLSPQDNAFMSELYDLMENEMSNTELDVNHLTERFHISRTKFYYKVKGLTGTSPSTFFKTYKLNRAAELLKDGKYTISEIADMTGFSTPSIFTTNFKKQFGVPPSEYQVQKNH